MLDGKTAVQNGSAVPMHAEVNRLLQNAIDLWWSCPVSAPDLGRIYSRSEQVDRERQLEEFVTTLTTMSRRIPRDQSEKEVLQQQVIALGSMFAKSTLDCTDVELEAIRVSGLVEASVAFVQAARQYDPTIRPEDIYQAGRNTMTMYLLQLLAGLPVSMTPSIFAYSMLYPYSDNYLDDPTINGETKRSFNERINGRLKGTVLTTVNTYERKISDLVAMIETQYDRMNHPRVFDSLDAIHHAQTKSLNLLRHHVSPYEVDILGISFEKGGTAVLADAYLVTGLPDNQQLGTAFLYGAFTQLMDDLEDVQADADAGLMTIFSQTSQHWLLNAVTNRLFHFGAHVLHNMDAFGQHAPEPLKAIMKRAVNMLLIEAAGSSGHLYSQEYLRELECHLPFRFSTLKKQRQKLNRQGASLAKIVEVLALSGDIRLSGPILHTQADGT